jgi:hypothetical protein
MWTIKQTIEFQEWYEKCDYQLQDDILEHIKVLEQFGPHLGRPNVDTLKGSTIANLKELRFNSGDKVIRITFVFDPNRNGVLLIGGDKAGSGGKTFYKMIIDASEKIYFNYLVARNEKIEKKTILLKKKKEK